MTIVALVIVCINIFKILKNLRHEPLAERLPWILYLNASFLLLPCLIVTLTVFNVIIPFEFLKIVVICIFIGPIVAGMLSEAFKPAWENVRFKWWLPILIILIVAGYCYLTYILNYDGFRYNDPTEMTLIGSLFLLPFLASLFPLTKAPDLENRKIYGFISGGFGVMSVGSIIALSLYANANGLLVLMVFSYIVMLAMIADATYLKLEQTQKLEAK